LRRRFRIRGFDVAKNIVLKLMMKDYRHISPLVSDVVVAEEIDLLIERDSPNALDRTLSDSSIGRRRALIAPTSESVGAGGLRASSELPHFLRGASGTAASSFAAAVSLRAWSSCKASGLDATSGWRGATHGAAQRCGTPVCASKDIKAAGIRVE
jgi:hypothetical protein